MSDDILNEESEEMEEEEGEEEEEIYEGFLVSSCLVIIRNEKFCKDNFLILNLSENKVIIVQTQKILVKCVLNPLIFSVNTKSFIFNIY